MFCVFFASTIVQIAGTFLEYIVNNWQSAIKFTACKQSSEDI